MPLVLEIEHLLGVAFAARGQDSGEPDWPPQPDRVFSALVASWAARGGLADERDALEWLEALPPPLVAASACQTRPAPTVFVPPNDAETGRVGNKGVLPSLRARYPRRFPAALPHDPTVQLVWDEAVPDAATLAALDALARDTAYVGHSASLTRCRFVPDGEARHPTAPARRRIYPGRLAELERAHAAGRRPSPGEWVRPAAETPPAAPRGQFSSDWLVFEIVGGDADLRASTLFCKALIKAVMSGYGGGPIPAAISGHQPDGSPTKDSHLAAVPMAFLGAPYADGRLFGLALAPPGGKNGGLLRDGDFQRAIKAIAPLTPDDAGQERRVLTLDGLGLRLALVGETDRASLDPGRYAGPARTWATATPIALDRHLKEKGSEARQTEIEAVIAQACVNIGLPAPTKVTADKHSAVEGAPSAYPSGRAPAWTGWRVPKTLESRALTHAVIQFDERVAGPVILGAGRFCGLGLCLPLDADRRR